MRRVSLNRVRGRLLGSVVLLVAIALWETWARLEPSFLVPPVSAVADRAWHVWPTSEFLTTVEPPA